MIIEIIITFMIIWILGQIVNTFLLAEDTQIELIKMGSFYKFSTIWNRIFKNTPFYKWSSWLGVIQYFIEK